MQKRSQQFYKKRQLAVFLPVVVVPFLSIIFYLMGGGAGMAETAAKKDKNGKPIVQGLNTSVPEVDEKVDMYSSKMKAYDRVAEDSIAKKKKDKKSFLKTGNLSRFFKEEEEETSDETEKTDTKSGINGSLTDKLADKDVSRKGLNASAFRSKEEQANAPEVKSLQKTQQSLARLNETVSAPPAPTTRYSDGATKVDPVLAKMLEEQQQRQKEMMELYKQSVQKNQNPTQSPGTADPSVTAAGQQSGTSPANQPKKGVQVKIESETRPVVSRFGKDTLNRNVAVQPVRQGNAFHSAGGASLKQDANVISAVLHEEQVLENGSTVKIRLLNTIRVGTTLIPRNTFIFGIARIQGERLGINISSIRYGEVIIPISLSVYDVDGLEGLFVPGSLTRTAAKQGASQGISGTQFYQGFATNVQTQLTQTAIETAKNVVSKKASIVRVSTKANYVIYLKPEEK